MRFCCPIPTLTTSIMPTCSVTLITCKMEPFTSVSDSRTTDLALEFSPQRVRVGGEEWRTREPTDLIFPKWQSELFKTILEEENLGSDRDGRLRTAYSLRHTISACG